MLAGAHEDLHVHVSVHSELAAQPELAQHAVLFQAVVLDLFDRRLSTDESHAAGGALGLATTPVADIHAVRFKGVHQLCPFLNFKCAKPFRGHLMLRHDRREDTFRSHTIEGMVNEERLVELFKELCLINAPALQEKESVAYVKTLLHGMGLEVWEDDAGAQIGGNANNLIATLRGNVPGAPRIYFSAHFDTVEPTQGLVIEERDGVFYSSGNTILGADDKGGMAPAIEAIRVLQETGAQHGDIVLLFSVAEEIGLRGAQALKIEDLNLDFGFVLDTGPPVGTFVTRTATHDKLDITIKGKPAHAGKDPEKGINAIVVASDAISGMRMGRIGPETTANLGVISGGTATNVVCAEVRIRAEARSTDVAALDEQVDHMIQRFEEAARKHGAEVHIDHVRHYDAYHIPDEAPVVRVALAASRKLGFEPTLRTTLGGSDANAYNVKGVPSIVVATGMDKIHTHEEFISRKDLVDLTRLCVEIALEAANVNSK